MSNERWMRVPTDDATRELIKQLKDRGYMVIHRDSVRTLGASKEFLKERLLLDSRRGFVAEMVRQDLALGLSRELLRPNGLAIREASRTPSTVEFRTELTWLGSRISLEDSEYPLFL
jgi:hypothetical protein